jgi:hypothetical protein
MGRAIDMENRLDSISVRVKNVEDALAKVIETVDSMQEKATTTKPVKPKVKKEKANASKEKADNEANGTSDE